MTDETGHDSNIDHSDTYSSLHLPFLCPVVGSVHGHLLAGLSMWRDVVLCLSCLFLCGGLDHPLFASRWSRHCGRAKCVWNIEVDRSVVMQSLWAGAALDPPLWIVSNKALSLTHTVSHNDGPMT